MKILVCSDIHGSERAAKLIENLDNEHLFDKIFLLGDVLYNGPRNEVPIDYSPKVVFETLNKLENKIVGVRGNCDADVDLMVLNFPLPKIRIIKINEKHFFLTHGDDTELFKNEPKEDEIYIKGHTHIPLLYKNKLNGIILNPGSMTFPKGVLNKSFMIIDDDIKLYEYEYSNDNANSIDIINIYSYNKGQFLK